MASNIALPAAIARSMLAPARRGSGRQHRSIRPCPSSADLCTAPTSDLLAGYCSSSNLLEDAQRCKGEGTDGDECLDGAFDGRDGERRYLCKQCGNTYSNRANLNVHLNVHSNSKCFPCDKCLRSFSRRSSLYNHKKTHCVTADVCKCNVCDADFESHEALLDHQPSHLDKNGLANYEAQCFVCAAILSTKFGLKLHIMQRHPEIIRENTEKKHVCSECDKKYSNETLLKAHMKTHSAVKVHACTSCDYSATTRVGLQRHVDRIHLKVRKFECSICGKLFVSQPDRKLHMLRHYKIKPVQCDLCPMRFYSTRELRKHKFAHSGQKPHRCDDCDVAFAYVESLRRHVSAHLPHPVTCDRCLKQFLCQKSLTKHMRSHPAASNIFKCSDCGKNYKNSKCLETHKTKLKHKNTVYCCHECGFEFQSIDLFNSHDRDGHKNLIFICKLCNISLKRQSKLVDHMWVRHGISASGKTQSKKSTKEISSKNISGAFASATIENESDDVCNDYSFSMKIENKYAEGALADKDTTFDEFSTIEGVEISSALNTLVDNYCPIEGVEVTTSSDALMDVFSCFDCDKQFPSERDRAEHIQCRHTPSPDLSTAGVATSIQVVVGAAFEQLSCDLVDLVEIDLSAPVSL